jgi:DNA replicative helicase MCM subunit Mcm2 (Cdc46/Mcm family)
MASSSSSSSSSSLDIFCLQSLWLDFFLLDNDEQVHTLPVTFFSQHELTGAIQAFKEFFNNQCICSNKYNIFHHKCLLQYIRKTALLEELNLEIDLVELCDVFPYDDFIDTLAADPTEVIGCLNMAISLLIWDFSKSSPNPPHIPFPVFVRLSNLPSQMASFSDLKAISCGRLLSIKGHVIRVSACSPLLEKGRFKCTMCGESTGKHFVDGIFVPVSISNNKFSV